MADLMSHSEVFTDEDLLTYYIKPLLLEDNDFRDLVTVKTGIKTGKKLEFFDELKKIVKGYAQGTSFTPSTGVTATKKTMTVADMKAEVEQNGRAFEGLMKQQLLNSGYEVNDIDGTIFKEILMSLYLNGIRHDRDMHAWFGDVVKEDIVSSIPDGSLDANYKEYDGFWTRIIDDIDAATIASGQFVDLNSTTYLDTAAVKQVEVATLTGTSGTANIPINGTNYLATFTTSTTVSATNFVTSHAATIAARFGKHVLTSSGADLILTAGIAGAQIDVAAGVNVSGDLDSTTAAATANVATGAIKTDGALAALEAVWSAAPAVLRKYKNGGGLRFMVTSSVHDNYSKTLRTLNGSDEAHRTLVNGVKRLSFNGIPIIEMDSWDGHIADDFENVRPHRILLVTPANLVFGVDDLDDDNKIESFYDQTNEKRVFRTEFKECTQYLHELYLAAAYA